MVLVRENVCGLGPDCADPILWYARTVARMKRRPLADPLFGRFSGSIHGFGTAFRTEMNRMKSTGTLPDTGSIDKVRNRCRHESLSFLPCRRGDLWTFVAILRDAVRGPEGSAGRALPECLAGSVGRFDLRIEPVEPVPEKAQISVGRVGAFREGC